MINLKKYHYLNVPELKKYIFYPVLKNIRVMYPWYQCNNEIKKKYIFFIGNKLKNIFYVRLLESYYFFFIKHDKEEKVFLWSKTEKTTAIRRTAVRGDGVSLHQWGPIEIPWNLSEHHNAIELKGLRAARIWAPIKPRDARFSNTAKRIVK